MKAIVKSSGLRGKRRQGFSLIELLVVLAVIGIIVGIAVNNYLTAKVRAQVTAAQANLKALVDANINHYIDNGVYISNPREVNGLPTAYFLKFSEGGLRSLTSPISYLSPMVSDPFQHRRVPRADGADAGMIFSWHYGTDPGRNITFVFESVGPDGDLDFPFASLNESNPNEVVTLPSGTNVSAGPGMHSLAYYFRTGALRTAEEARKAYLDGNYERILKDVKSAHLFRHGVYDPTNGTWSSGDIPAMP